MNEHCFLSLTAGEAAESRSPCPVVTKAKRSHDVVKFNDFLRPLWCCTIIRGLQKLNNKALNLIDSGNAAAL